MTNETNAVEPRNASGSPVAVIGFGVAGFNAAVGLRRAGYDGPIDVFSDLDTLPYSPILTSYYAGGMRPLDDCFPWTEQEVAELRLNVRSGCPVTGLDVAGHMVRTAQGDFPYAKCVIATGSSPSTAGFPADCGYEPMVLHSMHDAERLKAALSSPACRRVLVSGASMVALKTVEACLAQGKQVTLVGMNPHVLDYNALPPAAERFERGLEAKGVRLRLGQTVAAVKVADGTDGPGGRTLGVTFSDGGTDEFDEIVVAHGARCNLSFVDGALEVDQGLLVDEFMRTSDPDVYAAGDVAQALELTSGQRRIVGIWKNAAAQGAVAGRTIACELAGGIPQKEDAFRGSISSNTIAVDGTLFISAGTVDAGPDTHVEVREGDDMTVVYVYRKREGSQAPQLVGFNVASDVDEEGGVAYDTGAMLTLRILEGLNAR